MGNDDRERDRPVAFLVDEVDADATVEHEETVMDRDERAADRRAHGARPDGQAVGG